MKKTMKAGVLAGLFAAATFAESLGLNPETLKTIGRGTVEKQAESLLVDDATVLVNDTDLKNFTFSFEGRAPEGAGAEDVGIWASFRQFDRNHRYALALRGAPHSDLYLVRYAPDGNDRVLALEPVQTVAPGEWAEITVSANGEVIRVFLNGTEIISVKDPQASFKAGKVGVGGGYHRSEYRNVRIGDPMPDEEEGTRTAFANDAVKINFQPSKDPVPEGWKKDFGQVYSKARGYGWSTQVGTRNRKQSGELINDTLATIAHDQRAADFQLDLEPGDYLLTLHHGDEHPSALNMKIGSAPEAVAESTEPGQYKTVCRQVTVGGEGLTLQFSRKAGKTGTSINWLVVEPRGQLTAARWAKGGSGNAAKEALRKEQRAAYVPQQVSSIQAEGRSEISLDGDWLFLPDYEFKKTEAPQRIGANDAEWHVMNVPDLWSPYAAWLFGETFPDMPGDKGASDRYYEVRHARVEALTFDWDQTQSAWYRKHIELPEIPKGKRVELQFDAVAKVAYVYVNGEFVGKNYGMFGPFGFDVTDHLNAGSNVIAVKVDPERNDIENGDEIIDVAISVEVTRNMLSALPFGMTRQNARGIWQPTRLLITDAARITEVFVKPQLDGADVDVTLENSGSSAAVLTPSLTVNHEGDGSRLVALAGKEVTLKAGATQTVTLSFDGLKPRLWSPDDPQLYTFKKELKSGTSPVDSLSVVSGFKTFESKGNRLYLNGKPYALRGANHCPNILAPMDGELADRFFKIMRENNLNATRFHAVPGTKPWMEAADRNGVLISYEGTWPWLMLRGPIPPRESLDIWLDEFRRIIKRYRNHPSLALWTVNNEMKFHVWHKNGVVTDEDALARWKVVSESVQMIREVDPTHPVVADSCYIRNKFWAFKQSPEELEIDDGDIDDKHAYFNWYNQSVFNLLDHPDSRGSANRPLIGQEMSTGYYNGDSGHPVRAYLFAHQTPQSWVGQYAYEHCDPSIFYMRHCMLTKELAEYYRRERRDDWAGTLIFGLVTWFRDPWDAEKIAPYPVVTDGLRNAMAPVLVSARLTGRNLFAGESFTLPVSVINDAEDGKATPSGKLNWSIQVGGKARSKGSVSVSSVPYYSNKKMDVKLTAPATVPGGRADVQLVFELECGGKVISRNHYALRVAEKEWATAPVQSAKGKIYFFQTLEKIFPNIGKKVSSLKGLELGADDCLVIDGKLSSDDVAVLKQILKAGQGRVVWSHPQAQAKRVFPDQILNYRKQNGEVVTMKVDESPVFDGIEIGDMAWMGGPTVERVPISSLGGYHVNWTDPALTVLAEEMKAHGYLKTPKDKLKYWVTPLVKIQSEGAAPVILSEMSLEAVANDPIGLRLWANLLRGE